MYKKHVKQQYLQIKYIAGPVYRPNHWCLFIADCLKGEITYIDPLGTNRKKCDEVLENWKLFVKNSHLFINLKVLSVCNYLR